MFVATNLIIKYFDTLWAQLISYEFKEFVRIRLRSKRLWVGEIFKTKFCMEFIEYELNYLTTILMIVWIQHVLDPKKRRSKNYQLSISSDQHNLLATIVTLEHRT